MAMSSSPWERLWNGDEDVTAPFQMGAVSRCAPGQVSRGGGGRGLPLEGLDGVPLVVRERRREQARGGVRGHRETRWRVVRSRARSGPFGAGISS